MLAHDKPGILLKLRPESPDEVEALSLLSARLSGATEDEARAAARAVSKALAHPLLVRAREADDRGECRRETPLGFVADDGTLVENAGHASRACLRILTFTGSETKKPSSR